MIATGVSELAPVVGTSAACAALAVSRATSGRGARWGVRRGAKTPPLGAPIARSELRVSAKGPPMNGSVTSGQLNDRHRGGASSTRSGRCSSLLSRKPTGRSVRAHRASDRHPDARSDARSNAWVRGAGAVLTTRPLPFQSGVATALPGRTTVRRVGRRIGRSDARPTNGNPDQIERIATGTMLAYAAASTTSDHRRLSCQRVSYSHPSQRPTEAASSLTCHAGIDGSADEQTALHESGRGDQARLPPAPRDVPSR